MKNLYTLVLVFAFSLIMKAEVSVTEKNALLKLYDATNGSDWTVKWDLEAPVSNWFGIVLQDDKVISIQLPNNNLVGKLPTEISALVNLKTLDLFKNFIS